MQLAEKDYTDINLWDLFLQMEGKQNNLKRFLWIHDVPLSTYYHFKRMELQNPKLNDLAVKF